MNFLFLILLFLIPHLLFLLFTLFAKKKGKTSQSFGWKAATLASAAATVVLIFLSVVPIYSAWIGRSDPFFFVPLLQILFLGIPIALGILLIGWSVAVAFTSIQTRTKKPLALSVGILILIVIGLFIVGRHQSTLQTARTSSSHQTLETLSAHARLDVRRAVAKNPNTPPDVLSKLYEEKLPTGYRAHTYELAENPNTPPNILQKIYSDPDTLDYILYYLAENPNTPEAILRELANRPYEEQRSYINGLRNNPNLPEDLKQQVSSPKK